jgi:hypothetical protein
LINTGGNLKGQGGYLNLITYFLERRSFCTRKKANLDNKLIKMSERSSSKDLGYQGSRAVLQINLFLRKAISDNKGWIECFCREIIMWNTINDNK